MIKLFSGLMVASAVLLLAGCEASDEDHGSHSPGGTHDQHGAADTRGSHEGHDEATAEFEGLSAEDAALARVQKTCPVSDEPLGAMGDPVKVVTDGRTVFLCCEGCRKKFERDPATYLTKLDGTGK